MSELKYEGGRSDQGQHLNGHLLRLNSGLSPGLRSDS